MKTLTYLLLILSAALTVGKLLRAADGNFDMGTLGFLVWAISPYLVFASIVYLLARLTNVKHIWAISAAIAGVMLILTAYVYGIAMDGTSSTEALAFVVVPVYLHIGADIMLAIGIVLSKLFVKPSAA